MSFLNRAEDWIVRQLMKPTDYDLHPAGHPPKDDVPIALTLFVLFSLAIVATCGHYFAK
jgi:hypothetical protein